MTGNDIVDIATAAAESNWKRKGFLEKIFTRQEQQYIRETLFPERMVWKLWSMKESAYKIYTRQFGGRFFTPQKFTCTLFSNGTGQVSINEITYQTQTSITENYIYSIATVSGPYTSCFLSRCFPIPPEYFIKKQQYISENIVTGYARITGKEKKYLAVGKDKNGVPFLFCRLNKLYVPVSITHHGNYAAFTIN